MVAHPGGDCEVCDSMGAQTGRFLHIVAVFWKAFTFYTQNSLLRNLVFRYETFPIHIPISLTGFRVFL